MRRALVDEIIDEIIRNDENAVRTSVTPCCRLLLEEPWPAGVPELARRSPGEALKLLGSGWGGLAPDHAEEHLLRLGPNFGPGRGESRNEVFVIRGRGCGFGSSWIPEELLAPGDLILISEGDTVPADLRLLRVRELRVDQSALTGNARPVRKEQEWFGDGENPEPAGIPDLCFRGTRVVAGTATAMVVATGPRTLCASR